MVRIGNVKTFSEVKPDKAQALKVLEEAAEVVEAWKKCNEEALDGTCYHTGETLAKRSALIDECCDVITATCNLLASIGVRNAEIYMLKCEERNRKRGRL